MITFLEFRNGGETTIIDLRNGYDLKDAPGNVGHKLYGSDQNDTLRGLEGNDWLYAQDGDDVLIGGPGDDGLYGNDGFDVAIFDAAFDEVSFGYSRTHRRASVKDNVGTEGTDTLFNSVERVVFNDGVTADFSIGSNGMTVTMTDGDGTETGAYDWYDRVLTYNFRGSLTSETVRSDIEVLGQVQVIDHANGSTITRTTLDGLLKSVHTEKPNGDVHLRTISEDGTDVRTLTDGSGTKPYASVSTTRDSNGTIVTREWLYDNGDGCRIDYASDGGHTVTWTDGSETKTYDTLTTVREADRTIVTREWLYDNGDGCRIDYASDGGHTVTWTDGSETKTYDTLTTVREADRTIVTREWLYDNGDTWLRDYDLDGGWTDTREDVSDSKPWSTQTRVFDAAGNLLSSVEVADEILT